MQFGTADGNYFFKTSTVEKYTLSNNPFIKISECADNRTSKRPQSERTDVEKNSLNKSQYQTHSV